MGGGDNSAEKKRSFQGGGAMGADALPGLPDRTKALVPPAARRAAYPWFRAEPLPSQQAGLGPIVIESWFCSQAGTQSLHHHHMIIVAETATCPQYPLLLSSLVIEPPIFS